MLDDVDQDGRFALDADGHIEPPDLLLARAERHLLMFVARPPADPGTLSRDGVFVKNWETVVADTTSSRAARWRRPRTQPDRWCRPTAR